MENKITRPALVIGLGGTGQWILTFLKKDLLEYNQGLMPANVKLLAFDTIAQPQARQEGASAGKKEKDIRIGGIELIPNDEFIHLGKDNPDIFNWAEGIVREKKHAHISPWFQATEYIRTLAKDAFNLSTGAGQIRQFGRMAIFNDLSQPTNSAIWSRIANELKQISGGVASNNKLEVIICGSFAGGTGAGMIIDMAVLLREIARNELQDENKFMVRGFFVLPSAFGLSGQDFSKLEMQARAFATWRELDRFMIKNPKFGIRNIQYHEEHSALKKVEIRTRPYDACYLIDSHRPNNSLDVVQPEEGIYPSTADVISAIIDPIAGKHFTEHITANVNPIYVANPDVTMYSTIGSFTVKEPIYYTLEEITHLFALDALTTWLSPVKDAKDRVTGVSAAMNEELGLGKQGLDEALPFLRRTRITRGDDGVNATIFFNHLAEVVSLDKSQRGKLATTYSLPCGVQNNLMLLTNIGDSEKAKSLRAQIDAILTQRLINQVPLSREIKEKPEDGFVRIERASDQFLKNRFGRRLEDGTEVRGEYGEAAGQCRRYQTLVYRKMLALHVQNLLMGDAEGDPARARKGKLGYTHDLVRELVEIFDTYIGFLNDVDNKRQDAGKSQQIYMNYDKKRDEMREKAKSKILFNTITAPKAHEAQEKYIKAGQELADMRRDDLLLLGARETAEDMRAATVEMRDLLATWKITLAVGTEANPSLYSRIMDGLDYLRQGRERDAKLERVQLILEQNEKTELYIQDYEALKNILGRVQWKVYDLVEKRGNEEILEFKVECLFDNLSMDANNIRNIAIEWLTNCRKEYEYVPSQKLIGDMLVEKYGAQGASDFAKFLSDKADPLWQFEQGKAGARVRHSFVRVFHRSQGPNEKGENEPGISSTAVTFLDNLKTELGQLKGTSNLIVEMVNSGDPYKLSYIRSDDCIPSDNFKVWHTLRQAYMNHIQKDANVDLQKRNAILLHIFPAEVNVAEYEARWAAAGHTYEVFAPDVVMVLNDKKKARLFVLAYAAGLITADRTLRAMVLKLPERDEPIFLNEGEDAASKKDVDDFFLTMDAFTNYGQDIRAASTVAIPFDKLRPIIIEKADEQDKGYINFLKRQSNGGEGTLYSKLVKKYSETGLVKYKHMAEVAKFIFIDEMAEEEQWAS